MTDIAVKPKKKNLVDEIRSYRSTEVVIKPFIDRTIPNMGLEKYGQVMFEGTYQEQQLRCTEINGVVRYVTGLDEFSEDVKRLPEEERKAKVKSIRETVARMESEIFGDTIDPKDENFWSKCRLSPTKTDYWSTVKFTLGNEGLSLDPSYPNDLLIIIAAEAGGFDDIAGSYEEANSSSRPPKFYLERRKDARVQESKVKQVKDKAIFELYKIKSEEPQRLFWLAKNLLPIANQYKKTDPLDILYGDLSSFIEGSGIERDKKLAPVKFLAALEKSHEYLMIRAYVLEMAFLKRFITKDDNKIYNRETNTMLGANLEQVVEYLKDPSNQGELDNIEGQIDPIWAR